jgi:hypothetical protein
MHGHDKEQLYLNVVKLFETHADSAWAVDTLDFWTKYVRVRKPCPTRSHLSLLRQLLGDKAADNDIANFDGCDFYKTAITLQAEEIAERTCFVITDISLSPLTSPYVRV